MPHVPRRRPRIAGVAAICVALMIVGALQAMHANAVPGATAAQVGLDLSAANRRSAIPGLYDWSRAGYRGGAALPGPAEWNPDPTCQLTPSELATQYGVRPGDGTDDSTGLQAAVDAVRTGCSPTAGYTRLSVITLPAGRLDVSRQIGVDADYLVIRGAGSGAGGTRIVFRPDADTRYDALTDDGSDWDEDGMSFGQGKGGWLWPGRGLFRVQSRAVHASYAADHAAAPANRRDIFEGTVNVHWKAGVKLRGKAGDAGFAARSGDRVVHLATSGSISGLAAGALVNIRAANSMAFYTQQQAVPTEHPLLNQHMRQQIFTIVGVDTANRTLTLDKPLEYDVPVTSTSDGSAPIGGVVYDSKAAPLVDPVLGVGFENLAFTQEMPGLDPAGARHNYGNMAPAEQMHGIVFKWAANSWVRGVRAELTGSHPIVTEEAKNLQIVDNVLDGSWNKGKGGNGYFRGSRVWDSIYAGNTSRNLRHFTFQWSASGNVVIGNDFDSDLNLHGGWERNNLFELNTVTVPYAHRSANCAANCGEEGGGPPDASTWFPIWWGAGKKAVKWSGATGPRNVFFNNAMSKQLGSDNAPYSAFYPDRTRLYQFGWDGTGYRHLDVGGTPIADWAGNEQRDYTDGHGVDATRTDPGPSLFLRSVTGTPSSPSSPSSSSSSSSSPSSSPSGPAGTVAAAFVQTSVWSTGYGADMRLTNNGDAATTAWVVEFDLPAGSTVTSSWSSVRTSTGQHHRFTNAGYNGDIAPGATETFGFNVKGTGTPLNCTVNGVSCAGGPEPSSPAPSSSSSPAPSVSTSVPSGPTVNVGTADQLRAALAGARPGQTIRLAPGTYQGPFITQRAGSASAPITLTGPADAILTNDGPSGTAPSCPTPTAGWDPGYGLWLFDAPYWRLSGFSVLDTKKGVVLDNAHHVTIDGLTVRRTQDEGVHFRRSSADGIIRNSRISDTGLIQPGFGEGVYIGSSQSNFGCHGNSGGMDRSDRVQVLDNRIGPNVAAEHIDIKEGTEGGVVRGNTFDGRGISGQNSGDSWVDVKGNGYVLERNTGTFSAPGTFANGYETHNLLTGYGCGNTWRANTSDLGGAGRYAVFVSSTSKCAGNPNVVFASNTVSNATGGLTNITVTP